MEIPKEAAQDEVSKRDTFPDSNNLVAQSARSACRRTVEAMTSDERERIKRCIACFLCGDPGVLRCEVVYSMMDALQDAHLAELDAMIHIYEPEKTESRPDQGRSEQMQSVSALAPARGGCPHDHKEGTMVQDEARKRDTSPDLPRCEIRVDAINGIDETEDCETDGRLATRIITFRGDGGRWHRLWICGQCLSDGSFKREVPAVPGQEVQVFVFDRTID